MQNTKIIKIRPKNFLAQEEINKLAKLHKQISNKKADRIKVVLLYNAGFTHKIIAMIMQVTEETIRAQLHEYEEKKKLDLASGGSKSNLNKEQTQQLISHLKDNTYLYVKDIVAYVQKIYGILYSLSGMRHWLYHNNFRYKKPHGVPAKADKIKQETFISEYKKIKESLVSEKEPLYFVDSVHPQHQTQLCYGWILKGKRKELPTTGRQYRVNIIGGISLSNYHFVYNAAEKVNMDSIKKYLSDLRSHHPKEKKIHIVWDNAAYHTCKEVKGHAEKNNIEIHYLPAYSPNLNPIERLWKILHEKVTANKYYAQFSMFKKGVISYLEALTKGIDLEVLKSRLTDKFQVIYSPLLLQPNSS